MHTADDIKSFLRHLVNYLGKGYRSYLVVRIPPKKMRPDKKAAVLKKITQNYQTNLTRSQRAYAKSKGFANFGAVNYRDIVVILHTKGKIKPEIGMPKGFTSFNEKSSLNLKISPYLELIVFLDERKRVTVRLSRETIADFKEEMMKAFKSEDGRHFHTTLTRFSNLPVYRGIFMQKKVLHSWLVKKKKAFGVKWNLPKNL